MTLILNEEQIAFFVKNHYLHAKGVIPQDLLALAKRILNDWVEEMVDTWIAQKLITDRRSVLDFNYRLVELWNAADKPKYNRSPRRDLLGVPMYEFLKHPTLLDLGSDLLGSTEISVHGIFNARPKLPDQKWTDTPWHQDAQYYRDAENVPVISMWMPLQTTTEHNSCLQVAPGYYTDSLRDGFVDEQSGFLGLSMEDARRLQGLSIEMEAGDILCFNQMMPHRALPNKSNTVRWSMDIRYEATPTATESGKAQGFMARSEQDPSSVESYEQWLAKWSNIPKGLY